MLPKRDAVALQSNIEKKLRLARRKKDAFVLPSDTGTELRRDRHIQRGREAQTHAHTYIHKYISCIHSSDRRADLYAKHLEFGQGEVSCMF